MRRAAAAEIINKFRSSIQEKGVVRAVLWAARSAATQALFLLVRPRKSFMIVKSELDLVPKIRPNGNFVCRKATSADLDRFQRIFARLPRKRSLFMKRFERGQTCMACFEGNEAIGYIWISFIAEADPAMGVEFRPAEGQSYGFDLYVLPEHRPSGAGYALLAGWIDYSREMGKTSCVGYVMKQNKPMLLTTRIIFGFKPSRVNTTLTFLGNYGILLSSAPWQESPARTSQGG